MAEEYVIETEQDMEDALDSLITDHLHPLLGAYDKFLQKKHDHSLFLRPRSVEHLFTVQVGQAPTQVRDEILEIIEKSPSDIEGLPMEDKERLLELSDKVDPVVITMSAGRPEAIATMMMSYLKENPEVHSKLLDAMMTDMVSSLNLKQVAKDLDKILDQANGRVRGNAPEKKKEKEKSFLREVKFDKNKPVQ